MDNLYLNAALLPIIISLVSAIKATEISTKFAPFISIALGLVGVFLLSNNPDLAENILTGIGTGLAASGLYSGGKVLVKPE